MVLLMNAENTIERAWNKWGSFKKKSKPHRNLITVRKTAEIWDEERTGKFNTQKPHKRK